ncbi:hypothetical protein AB0H12_36765 [Actinosynnema sp. NPDC023794]
MAGGGMAGKPSRSWLWWLSAVVAMIVSTPWWVPPLSRLVGWFLSLSLEEQDQRAGVIGMVAGVVGLVPAVMGLLVSLAALRRSRGPGNRPEPARAVGSPVRDVPPSALEVRRTLKPRPSDSGELPPYFLRAHDALLDGVVAGALADPAESGIAVLVNGSTSGKSRALFEVLRRPVGTPAGRWWRRRPTSLARAGWRIWPAGQVLSARDFLDQLSGVGPRTVVWLNEAQRYLIDPPPDVASAIAAGLRALLARPESRPILVLGTLWPQYHDQITRQAREGEPDRFADARALLAGHTIRVPGEFSGADLDAVRASTDSRVRQAVAAADAAGGGQAAKVALTQYLAGVPELMDLYEHAPPHVLAVVHAAMDARRLGFVNEWLPVEMLRHAAPAYLDDWEQRDYLGDPEWFAKAVETLTSPRTAAAARVFHRRPALPGNAANETVRLDDYLEDHGQRTRRYLVPPRGFWDAARQHAAVVDVAFLAMHARERHRLRIAAALRGRVAEEGDPGLVAMMAMESELLGNSGEAEELYRRAARAGYPLAVMRVDHLLRQENRTSEADNALERVAEAGDGWALARWARRREELGAHAEAEELALRAARAGDRFALGNLTRARDEAGEAEGAERCANRAADAGFFEPLKWLASARARRGDCAAARRLAVRAAANDPDVLWEVADDLEGVGHRAEAEEMAALAADAGRPGVYSTLARSRRRNGYEADADRLVQRAVDAGDGFTLSDEALKSERNGDHAEAERLAYRAADCGSPRGLSEIAATRKETDPDADVDDLLQYAADAGDPDALAWSTERLERAGDHVGAEQAAIRALDASGISVVATGALVKLITLREAAGEHDSADALAARGLGSRWTDGLVTLVQLREESGDRRGAEESAFRGLEADYEEGVKRLMYLRYGDGEWDLALRAANAGKSGLLVERAESLRDDAVDEEAADLYDWVVEFGLEPDGSASPRW